MIRLSRIPIIIGIVVILAVVVLLGNVLITSPAALTVISDPSGQKVLLDGKEVGTTPFTAKDFKGGEVTLAFGDFSQKIKLTAGAETVVNWVLGPAASFSAGEIVWFSPSPTGTELVVISKPAAEVFLEGNSIGSSPLSHKAPAGEYSLEIKKEGYFSRTLKIAAKEGYRLTISANLSLDPFPAEEKEITAGGEKIKVLDLSSSELLLLADYSLWVKGATFWAERDEAKSYDYFLTAEGKLYDSQGSEVSLASLAKQTEAVTVGYLGESGKSLAAEASATLGKLQAALFPAPKPQYQVQILNTPTGWLRVRSGPGTNYSELGKVNPGEKYEYLGEEKNWFKIRFQEKEGWVSGEYSKKV